jgi:lysophospholipase L1-like esterase
MLYENAELYNISELLKPEEGKGFWMSRLPEHIRMHLNPKAQQAALNGCGCEIRFSLRSGRARIVLQRDSAEGIKDMGLLEVYRGTFQSHYEMTPRYIGNKQYEMIIDNTFDDMELLKRVAEETKAVFDPGLIRIMLPYDWSCRLVAVEGDIQPPAPDQTPQRKLLAYGSSITHGGSAVAPSGTYAMRTAARLGMDLRNLGFAGSAMLEPEMAEFISDSKDWDIAMLELGVNVLDSWSTGEFAERADAFLSAIAERNVGKWIFCTDIFTMRMDLEGNPKVHEFRSVVRNIVERLRQPKLVYLSGTELFSDASLLSADLVHPSAAGQELIAANMAAWIRKIIHS